MTFSHVYTQTSYSDDKKKTKTRWYTWFRLACGVAGGGFIWPFACEHEKEWKNIEVYAIDCDHVLIGKLLVLCVRINSACACLSYSDRFRLWCTSRNVKSMRKWSIIKSTLFTNPTDIRYSKFEVFASLTPTLLLRSSFLSFLSCRMLTRLSLSLPLTLVR